MTVVAAPGVYAMPAEEYHADPCPVPSLSRGIAMTLVRHSPRRARWLHPRLGGKGKINVTQVMDDGSAIHSLLLGIGSEMVALASTYGPKHELAGQPVRDFKTTAAKEEREHLRAMGKIPVLAHRLPGLLACADTLRDLIEAHPDAADFLAPGQSEAVVIWREDDIWLRCMIDRLPDNRRAPQFDLKLTEMSAAPGGWERRLQSEYAFQDAFYRRGIARVRGQARQPMRFIVGELEEPHDLAVMAAAPSLAALADAEVERAVQLWRRCMKTGEWPGLPALTAWVEPTSWQMTQADDAALRAEIMEELA